MSATVVVLSIDAMPATETKSAGVPGDDLNYVATQTDDRQVGPHRHYAVRTLDLHQHDF
jgi:hypothetical protein